MILYFISITPVFYHEYPQDQNSKRSFIFAHLQHLNIHSRNNKICLNFGLDISDDAVIRKVICRIKETTPKPPKYYENRMFLY